MKKLLPTAIALGSLVVLGGCAVHGSGYTYTYVEPTPVYQYYRPYYHHYHYRPYYHYHYRPYYYRHRYYR